MTGPEGCLRWRRHPSEEAQDEAGSQSEALSGGRAFDGDRGAPGGPGAVAGKETGRGVPMSAEAIAAVAAAVVLLAVLVPLQLATRADLAALRREMRADLDDRKVADVRRELAALAERLARVEGALGRRAPAAGGEPGDGDPEGRPA